MRIGINALGSLARDTGGKTYMAGLLEGLGTLGTNHSFKVFIHPESASVFRPLPDNFSFYRTKLGGVAFLRVLVEQSLLPLWCSRLKLDCLYSPNNSAPLFASAPLVLGIQNILPFFVNDDEGWIRERYRKWILPRVSRKVRHIIVPSKHAKEIVQKRLQVADGRITAIPHGVNHDYFHEPKSGNGASTTRFGAYQPYMLWVSALWNYKNWQAALQAFSLFTQRSKSNFRFIMVGRTSDRRTEARFQDNLRKMNLKDRVIVVENIEPGELADVYRKAEMLIYPSRVESFGLPMVEAMASGIPIVASGCQALREVSNGAAVHVEPMDAENLALSMAELVQNKPLRQQLIQRGLEQAQKFSWMETARKTLEVIETCARENGEGH